VLIKTGGNKIPYYNQVRTLTKRQTEFFENNPFIQKDRAEKPSSKGGFKLFFGHTPLQSEVCPEFL